MTFGTSKNKILGLEERLQELLDKEAIRGIVARTCRSIDRLDQHLLASCFHPDANVDYSPFYKGPVQGLIDSVPGADKLFEKSQYNTGTQLIEVDGNIGRAETYIWVMKVLPDRNDQGEQYGRISQMRYLDKMECRNGEWRIIFRHMVPEVGVFHTFPGEQKSIGMFKAPSEWTLQPIPSKRDRTDISYNF